MSFLPPINNAEDEPTSFLSWAPVNADKTRNFKGHYSPAVCFLLNTDKREGVERASRGWGRSGGPAAHSWTWRCSVDHLTRVSLRPPSVIGFLYLGPSRKSERAVYY